ncbi:Myb-like DNA-binding domain containing protein [Trichomonas vaginalis G3]|uniref:Myb-like DNA-binding domain containing protein n=1 Tax=Trichomonas vaginalis (strain ATCC PRA-98 / G3) TaxID=412133 RepID=A2DYD8_TRIV3|nr:RNA polymerase II transcription regulator recruiting protein [Trichomonas vaginalis G3]EAY14615.1 Myb-like DNA-binding domain containing protein [Trichomonas vaginalis G3]KAI5526625.1 RNA polymerase II transcription regulator recruiting protein [Trichomonas vaginalis G3]|eukprot:XP_001326838.1 Myb-like DNA-binding domain containing protein [Trichomonas vaginalis G3]
MDDNHEPGGKEPSTFEDESTLRKRFSPEEDERLKMLVNTMENVHWKEIAEHMPGRNARQCRDRYNNYLFKEIINKPWTQQEDEVIMNLFELVGPKWSLIAKSLSGRSGNNVKNRWYKFLKKNLKNFHKNSIQKNKCRDETLLFWNLITEELEGFQALKEFGI